MASDSQNMGHQIAVLFIKALLSLKSKDILDSTTPALKEQIFANVRLTNHLAKKERLNGEIVIVRYGEQGKMRVANVYEYGELGGTRIFMSSRSPQPSDMLALQDLYRHSQDVLTSIIARVGREAALPVWWALKTSSPEDVGCVSLFNGSRSVAWRSERRRHGNGKDPFKATLHQYCIARKALIAFWL